MATGELTSAVPAQQAAAWGCLAGRVALGDLPARDLDVAELQELVASIASDPSAWAHLVGFDD